MANDISDLKSAVGDLTVIIKQFKDSQEGRLKAQEERMSQVELKLRDQIIAETGPKGIPSNKFSFTRCMYAVATKDWSLAPFEKEEIDRYREKTMLAGAFSLGGALIPAEYTGMIVDLLRAKLVLPTLGVTVMDGLVGSPVKISKITGEPTYFWVNEDSSITDSNIGTGNINLTPHKLAAIVKLTKEANMLANPSLEAITRNSIALSIARGIEIGFFRGTGVLGEVTGMINSVPALPTTAYTETDALTKLNSLKKAIRTVENNNADSTGMKWAGNPTSYWTIGELADLNGRPYLQTDPSQPNANTLLGYQFVKSTVVAPSSGTGLNQLYFGAWASSILGIWSTLQFSATDASDTAFTKDELWIKATTLVDTQVLQENNFTTLAAVDDV